MRPALRWTLVAAIFVAPGAGALAFGPWHLAWWVMGLFTCAAAWAIDATYWEGHGDGA